MNSCNINATDASFTHCFAKIGGLIRYVALFWNSYSKKQASKNLYPRANVKKIYKRESSNDIQFPAP